MQNRNDGEILFVLEYYSSFEDMVWTKNEVPAIKIEGIGRVRNLKMNSEFPKSEKWMRKCVSVVFPIKMRKIKTTVSMNEISRTGYSSFFDFSRKGERFRPPGYHQWKEQEVGKTNSSLFWWVFKDSTSVKWSPSINHNSNDGDDSGDDGCCSG